VLADALQHIDQVGVGIDALELAGYQQALNDTDAFRTDLGPAKQPVLFSSRDDPQAAFSMIGVDRHVRVGQEDLQARHPRFGILQGLG